MLITEKKNLSVPRKVGMAFMAFALINASCVMAFSAPEKNSNSDTPAVKASNEKAVQIVKNMKFGWNLGNTLDATAGGDPANGWSGANKSLGIKTETNWGKPETTQAMIKGLKASGISTIRLPISWHDHIDSNYNIDSAWMNRVKTIVDWAMDEGLYVIINIHHDNVGANALKKNSHKGFCPAPKCKEESERYLAKIWQQIAAAFNNGYDEHLIFEVMNEPRLPGDPHEWNWEASCKTCNEAMECINGYTFEHGLVEFEAVFRVNQRTVVEGLVEGNEGGKGTKVVLNEVNDIVLLVGKSGQVE